MQIILVSLIVSFWGCSAGASNQDQDKVQQPIDTSLSELLDVWKKDSTGCLKLRSYEVAEQIVSKLSLLDRPKDFVISQLGPPNDEYIRQKYIPYANEDREFIHMAYYFDIHCKDGVPTPNRLNRCWLEVIVHPLTNKVVFVGYPCS